MIELFSIEFWIGVLFFINFSLVLFLFVFVRKINRLNLGQTDYPCRGDEQEDTKQVSRSASDIIQLLEPLVEDSRKAAIRFDEQIKEKKRLLKGLNDALDSRIISINLLLSRADAMQKKLEERQTTVNRTIPFQNEIHSNPSSNAVFNQQNQILEMYLQNFDSDTIAQRLSIPKGEVQLVIDLKKKFIAMEKNSQ